jgi:dihydrofolate synthase/folylpolyglutamate synthase
VTERIVIDGEPITAASFVSTYDELTPFLTLLESDGGRRLTFFELLTALGFAAFAEAPVSAAVIEVGIGGTWDATNVIDAAVAVIAPIGLDHQQWLGDSIASIAGEKAGIVKAGSLTVMARQEPEAEQVVLRAVSDVGAIAAREGVEFEVVDRRLAVGGQMLDLRGLAGTYDDIFLPLHGAHQAQNAALALAAVEGFLGGGRTALEPLVVAEGFAAVTSPGRLELVRRGPTVLLDVAHNPAGAQALARAVAEAFTFTSLVGVVGILADKDASSILEALEPVLAEVVITASRSPRAADPGELASIAREVFGDERVHVAPAVPEALELALEEADARTDFPGQHGAGVLVTGSVTVVAEARTLLVGAT